MLGILGEILVLVALYLAIKSHKEQFWKNVLIYSICATLMNCLLGGFSLASILAGLVIYFIFGIPLVFILCSVETYDSPYLFVIVGIVAEILIGLLASVLFGLLGIAM